ncbi:hypothetical protein BDZ89DRAFT_1072616, partial [Hymenopellis radicata]
IKPRTEVRSLTLACLDSSGVTFPTLFNLVPSPPQFPFTCPIVPPEAWTPTLLAPLAQASLPELLALIVVSNSPATVVWPTVPDDWAYPVFNNLVRDLRRRGVRATLA